MSSTPWNRSTSALRRATERREAAPRSRRSQAMSAGSSVSGTAVCGSRLTAGHGYGPQIPCTGAIVIARKLAAGTLAARGAMPCVGLFSLDECLRELEGYDVRTIVERTLI